MPTNSMHKQKQSIIDEVQNSLDNLKEFESKRREWYQDQYLRIADRQSQYIVFVSSVSATILALVATIPTSIKDSKLSVGALLLNVLLGIFLYSLLIEYDMDSIKSSRSQEINIFAKMKASIKKFINTPTAIEESNMHKAFDQIKNELENTSSEVNLKKSILNIGHVLFSFTFLLGITILGSNYLEINVNSVLSFLNSIVAK